MSILEWAFGDPHVGSVGYWYNQNRGVCPNCKSDMKAFPPEANLWPHFTNSCAKTVPPTSPEITESSKSQNSSMMETK
jgi:hypothetical protein